MAQDTINNNLYVAGNLACQTFTPPSGCIGDSAIAGSAGIQSTKLTARREIVLADPSATAGASKQQTIHVIYGATGTLVDYSAGAVVPLGSGDTYTVDLYKNGSSILTAVISLASTDGARTLKAAGGFTSTSLADGDWLEVKTTYTHSSGTAPEGVTIRLTLDEAPQ
jgi:hypothetical protein